MVSIALYLICVIHALVYTRKGEEILHIPIWPRPSARTPTPGVIKFTIFGRLFLGHHYYTLSLFDLCLSEET